MTCRKLNARKRHTCCYTDVIVDKGKMKYTVINGNSSSKGRTNVSELFHHEWTQQLYFHDFPGLSIGNKYFPPPCRVCISYTFFVPSYFYSFYSPHRQKGRQSVIECYPCLPLEANGSKYWFCLSSPSSEWQAHLCINKLHTDRKNHLYCLL